MWSENGKHWWDGNEWIDASLAPPEAGTPPAQDVTTGGAENAADPAAMPAQAGAPVETQVVTPLAKNAMFETSDQIECKERLRGIFRIGQQYDIFLPGIEQPAGYCHRGFNFPFMACDFTFYTDHTKTQETLQIKQRNGFDSWGTFDLIDSANGQHVCTFQRKFWAGMFQRQWIVTNTEGQELFMIQEDSLVKSLLRRFGGGLFPPLELILRTNMNFRTLDGNADFGAFNRKFSLRDRYEIIRNTPDLDGRILWAVGPLLDNAGGR